MTFSQFFLIRNLKNWQLDLLLVSLTQLIIKVSVSKFLDLQPHLIYSPFTSFFIKTCEDRVKMSNKVSFDHIYTSLDLFVFWCYPSKDLEVRHLLWWLVIWSKQNMHLLLKWFGNNQKTWFLDRFRRYYIII